MGWCFWKKKKKKKTILKKMSKVETVGLIVGHTKSDKGASIYNGAIQEYDYWSEVCENLNIEKDYAVGFRDRNGVAGACAEIRAKLGFNPDVIIELHFNSYNGKAKGCEALYTNSKDFAEKFCFFMEERGRYNRGAKDVYKNGRGIKNIEIAQRYSDSNILIEPFFADNKEDYISIKDMTKHLQDFINWL